MLLKTQCLRLFATMFMKNIDLAGSGAVSETADMQDPGGKSRKEKFENHTNKAVRLLKTLKSDFSRRGKAVRLLKTSLLWV